MFNIRYVKVERLQQFELIEIMIWAETSQLVSDKIHHLEMQEFFSNYHFQIWCMCPCIIYEIDERYPLDATIYLLL